jgi:hypothetical protein
MNSTKPSFKARAHRVEAASASQPPHASLHQSAWASLHASLHVGLEAIVTVLEQRLPPSLCWTNWHVFADFKHIDLSSTLPEGSPPFDGGLKGHTIIEFVSP